MLNLGSSFDQLERYSDAINLYKKAKQYAIENSKNLIIAGGTGFYLKALVDGISFLPFSKNDWAFKNVFLYL